MPDKTYYCDLCGAEKVDPWETCLCGGTLTTDGRAWYQFRIRTILGQMFNIAVLCWLGRLTNWWLFLTASGMTVTMLVLIHTPLATWIVCEFEWMSRRKHS